MRRSALTIGAVLGVATLTALSGCGASEAEQPDEPTAPATSDGVAGAATIEGVGEYIDALPVRQIKPPPTMRLDDGLMPPTNRWFSGLVFGDTPQPVFPMPLAYTPTESGFAVGLPTPLTSEKGIIAPALEDVGLDVGAASFTVSAYDSASVTMTFRDDAGTVLGSAIVVEGSPFVSYTAEVAQDVALSVEFGSDAVPTAIVGERTYALATDGTLDGGTVTLDAGQVATVVVAPDAPEGMTDDEALEELVALAASPVLGTAPGYVLAGDVSATTLTYFAEGGNDTAFVRMPHQGTVPDDATADCGRGSYDTVYGTVDLCTGTELSWETPILEPSGTLDLDGLSDEHRSELADQVRADIAAIPDAPSDTYFGGKALYRDTNLLVLAEELGLDDVAAPLREELEARITEWAEPDGCDQREARCFVYDDAMKGVVGLTPSFGSEEFNDHHFHYGYFLYSAGVLAAEDPELVETLRPVIDVLAADIASPVTTEDVPALRAFDTYKGHSWASGTSPFADGNNQESSSEAVTAWNGLGLWAAASGNDGLLQQARWMLSAEAASSSAYWTNFPLDEPVYDGFDHTITSLVWGGKRDYATWFSAEPGAMLGIVVLPMSPVSEYLAQDPERIATNIESELAGTDVDDAMFGDFLLMYSALAGPDAAADALEEARELKDSTIDDGNTRSYMLASIMTQLD